ncbi:MAG: MFS transporter [Sumerlaeia bacterium]
MPVLLTLALIVFLQLTCLGINFSTLAGYNDTLGGTAETLGLLWFALSGPRAVSAPFWGMVSDRWGRKPVMVIGTLAMMAGSVLWAAAGSVTLLIASRLVDSVLSGQSGVAQAIVADATPLEKRAAGMGAIGAAVSLAFTIGPLTGGLLGPGIGYAQLGWIMFALQGAALLLILLALPETLPEPLRQSRSATPRRDLFNRETWSGLFSNRQAVWVLALSIVLTVGYTHFMSAYPLAIETWFGLGEADATKTLGYAFAVVGLASAIAQGGLLRPLIPRLGEKRLILAGVIIMAAGMGGIAFLTANLTQSYIAIAIMSLGAGLALPTLTALLSQLVRNEDQGTIMGISQSAQTLGRGLGPWMATSLFAAFGAVVPFLSAVVLILLSGLMMLGLRLRRVEANWRTPPETVAQSAPGGRPLVPLSPMALHEGEAERERAAASSSPK